MKSYLRAVEVWRPADQGGALVFDEGLYGEELSGFREASVGMRFGPGEGLPGQAWTKRHPIVLKDFRNSYFKRTEAAEAAGLTCGIALPIFVGAELRSVVVFFCGDDEDHVGVIELWKHDPTLSPGIKFVDGHFGIAETFEWNAKHITFMPGTGLPGIVWLRERPQLLTDLGNAFRFIRAGDARRVGLNQGLGIPCPGDEPNVWVMLFLSALGTPIAQRQEVWAVEEGGTKLAFRSGSCARNASLADELEGATIEAGDGTIGQALVAGAAKIGTSLAAETGPAARSAVEAGLSSVIALPIHDGVSTSSVVCLYFE